MSGEDSGEFGAILMGPDCTRFRFWAPDKARVGVAVNGVGDFEMARREDGVFEADVPVGAGACYRYQIEADQAVPDPASRGQHGDVFEDSMVVDPRHDWKYPDWKGRPWHEVVLYELHAGASGGFKGICKELPRLAALGVTAIELMPVAEFPGRHSWGYDGVLHYAPDAAYGTPDELRTMIDTAHGLGLMVMLDVVYNHFGPAGNCLNEYCKPFFRDDIHTPWGSAIDFRKPQVRRFYIDNALMWLRDYRFDGLRFDAVSMIKDPTFLLDMAGQLRRALPDRFIHLVVENENNEAAILGVGKDGRMYDGQWTDDWHHSMHVLLTGETVGYYEDFLKPAAQLARCLREGFAYQGEPSKHQKGEPRGNPSGHLPTTSFIVFLQNHDQIGNRALGERLTVLVPPARLRAATLLMLMMPQIPMIFMGDEWAETKPFLFFTDHEDELAEMIREGRRKEFAHFPAFSDPEKRELIPDPNAFSTFIAAVPQRPIMPTTDQAAMSALYEAALKLRHQEIVPRIPGAVSLGAEPLEATGVRAQWKMGDGAVLTLAANFGNTWLGCEPVEGDLLISAAADEMENGKMPPASCFAWLKRT